MTAREKMDIAAKEFEDWFIQNFLMIGERGPSAKNARSVFDQVTLCIVKVEREHGDPRATSRE